MHSIWQTFINMSREHVRGKAWNGRVDGICGKHFHLVSFKSTVRHFLRMYHKQATKFTQSLFSAFSVSIVLRATRQSRNNYFTVRDCGLFKYFEDVPLIWANGPSLKTLLSSGRNLFVNSALHKTFSFQMVGALNGSIDYTKYV